EQTKKILQSLDAPLNMIVFAQETDFSRFRDKLPEYGYVSKNVHIDYVDADKQPAKAKQYQVQSYGTVVLEYKGRTERIVSDQEQELTNGIIKVVTGRERKLYLIQGHGEHDTTSSERTGYSSLATALRSDNFAVDKLVLAQVKDVPDDATVVVIAGPRTDYLPQEVDALRRYLRKGGKLLVEVDTPEKGAAGQFTNLSALLKEWAIEMGDNVVVDISGVGQLIGTDASVPVAATYPSHAITQQFNLLTAYPLARSMTPMTGVTGKSPQTFVETSARSWAETDIQRLMTTGEVNLDTAKGDKQGPISIAVAVSGEAPDAKALDGAKPGEGQKPETRVAAIGDSDFAANYALGIQGNRDLFMNTVNWLSQQENLISIRPKEPEDRRITLTADQQRRIFWLSLVIIPGAVLAGGVYTWWRRR
ncbi:MAG: GldG family protein, partial [Acidobacteria bacterium]|nr:GldG family protein [Acidobacteriota bacterium]